jgi:hypothetical protein
MIYIQFIYVILQLDNIYINVCVCVFIAKTSYFIVVIVPQTDEIVDRFRLLKPNNRLVPANSQMFISDEQAIDQFP